MSSRSNGVTNVRLSRPTTSRVTVVALVLVRLDPADELGAVLGEALEQLEQQARDVDGVARRRGEQVEELAALGRQADAHRRGRISDRERRRGSEHVTVEPAAGCSRGVHRAARRRHDVLDDREPEPGSARRAPPVAAVEALEEAWQIRVGDAEPVVGRR